ncbi:MAG: aldehyde dehydrogenase family protein [Lachnospiraceae bacterium]|nr:aldehyde dehydrogenase family protein [Lachnospiraceae bacterium]
MEYTKESLGRLVAAQKEYFAGGQTLDVSFRLEMLKKLYEAVKKHEAALILALGKDLCRAPQEAYLTDIGPLLTEIGETAKGLKKWARPETHFSGFSCFPSLITKVYKMPYGTCLIISPFNFPVLLSLGVLAAAIAGGNTAVLKVSAKAPACAQAVAELVADTFPSEYVTVVKGGHEAADMLLEERFDKIFYTGSPRVAKHIMAEAAKNLTPVGLELGGETGNWCIVRKDADLKDAARKIAFMKILNAGQVCININQVAVEESVAEKFVQALAKAIRKQLGEAPENNPEYPRLISRAAYEKCAAEAETYRDRIVCGGKGNEETLRYAPTVIYSVGTDEEIVNHELFCPLLPIVPYAAEKEEQLLQTVSSREHGLALYVFTKDKAWARRVMQSLQYGGGCVNEVCLHLMVKGVPFNGTGHSGMGAYHGIWGFREFTHPSTVLWGGTHFNLSLREHPYTQKKLDFLKKVEK